MGRASRLEFRIIRSWESNLFSFVLHFGAVLFSVSFRLTWSLVYDYQIAKSEAQKWQESLEGTQGRRRYDRDARWRSTLSKTLIDSKASICSVGHSSICMAIALFVCFLQCFTSFRSKQSRTKLNQGQQGLTQKRVAVP